MEFKIKYLISTKCLLLEVQNDINTNNWYVKTTKIIVCQSVLSQPLWQIQPSRGQNGLQACTRGSKSIKRGKGNMIVFLRFSIALS